MNDEEIAAILAKKIPVTSDEDAYYIVAVDPASEAPTDRELEMISLYQRFSTRVYNDKAREELLKMPIPAARGHDTTFFRKEPFGDWSYRRRSRSSDLPWLPDNCAIWTLHQVLDDAQKKVSHWGYWKSRYRAFQASE